MRKQNLKDLLNLNYIDLTNQTIRQGKYDFPSFNCPNLIEIAYLGLYKETKKCKSNPFNVLTFFEYDKKFDNINGLYNSIYYNRKHKLEKFKKKFSGIKIFAMPDYTQDSSIEEAELIHRMFRTRLVSIWLIHELNAIVIPLITYCKEESFSYMLDGIKDSEVVIFNTKGDIKHPDRKTLLTKAIKYTVDNMPNLKKIIVYSDCANKNKVINLFSYGTTKNIEIIIPDNKLLTRNIMRNNG